MQKMGKEISLFLKNMMLGESTCFIRIHLTKFIDSSKNTKFSDKVFKNKKKFLFVFLVKSTKFIQHTDGNFFMKKLAEKN